MVSRTFYLILIGPPGTGKTDLARRIFSFGNKIINNKPIEAVASYEWGRYEVIGGMSITSNGDKDSFHFGCVTNAIYKRKFLLIDEFNRADMNKAFGQMFLKKSKIHYWCQIRKRSFDDGPPRPIQTLNITKVENTIIIPAGEPGKNGTVTSFCPFNTGLTGGAYRKDPNAVIVNSAPTANNSGWTVSGVNSFPFAVLVY